MIRKTWWKHWDSPRRVDGSETAVMSDSRDVDIAQVVHRVGVAKVEIYYEDGTVVAYTNAPEYSDE